MNILLANDDGIEAEGIAKLAQALSSEHDVYVCAPDSQRSASSHLISIRQRVVARPHEMHYAKMAYSLTGSPADCVKMGIELYEHFGISFDAVFSGINNGANIGTDTIYSGTVAAAVEGAVCGLPSVAVSISSLHPKHYELACELALKAASLDLAGIDSALTLNINIPDLPKEEVQGVKVVPIGLREYEEWYNLEEKDDGSIEFSYDGKPVYYERLTEDDSDVGAHQKKYASITPLHFDMTSYELIGRVREAFAL